MPGDEKIFGPFGEENIPATNLYRYRKVLVTRRGVPLCKARPLGLPNQKDITNDGEPSLAGRAKYFLRGLGADLAGKRVSEPAKMGTDRASCEYFHWLGESIPRLLLLHEQVPDRKLYLPVKAAERAFVQESLALLSITDYSVFDRCTRFDDLAIAEHAAPDENFDATLMRRLREKFLQAMCLERAVAPSEGARLFVTRRNADKRQIANEKAVLPVLRRYGFQIVDLAEFSFGEQIRLLADCSLLLSNHGAGLTNMLFMPEGASVIELRWPRLRERLYFFNLANALRLPYYYLECEPAQSGVHHHFCDVLADPGALDRLLEQVIDTAESNRPALVGSS